MFSYKYYDTPEGHDIYKKLFVTSKYATITGLSCATLDVLTFSHPKGFFNTVGRFAWYVGPLVGMASAFTVTANVAQNFRGKNDGLNYFLGGVTAGAVFGAWAKSPVVGFPVALLLGVAGMVKKTGRDAGYVFFPDIKQATKTIQSVRHDWTIVKDLEHQKSWVAGKN